MSPAPGPTDEDEDEDEDPEPHHRHTDVPPVTQEPESQVEVNIETEPSSPDPLPALPNETPIDEVTHATADVLFPFLSGQWQGCRPTLHVSKNHLHDMTHPGNHYKLEDTYMEVRKDGCRQALFAGLKSPTFPPNKGRRRDHFTTAESLRADFEGVAMSEDGEPIVKNICLHKEETPPGIPVTSFDIDSLLVCADSLGVVKSGFEMCRQAQFSRNFKASIHLHRSITYPTSDGDEQTASVEVHRIPHHYIGKVDGLYDASLYIFFPRLYDPDKEFKSLSKDQSEQLWERLLWPALSANLGSTSMQSYPTSQRHDAGISQARYHETRTGLLRADEPVRRTLHTYHVAGEYLAQAWQQVEDKTHEPSSDLDVFRDAFILVSTKNTKIRYRQEESLADAMYQFATRLDENLDITPRYSTQTYIDLGRQVCGPYSRALYTGNEHEGGASTYLWRRCCLEDMHDNLCRTIYDGMQGKYVFYTSSFLHDAPTITSEPPRTSSAYRGGLRYLQAYNSIKEVFDAHKVYPFQGQPLHDLATDPGAWHALAATAKAIGNRDRATLISGYQASKQRVDNSIQDSCQNSYGSRLEVRVDWPLFCALFDRARQHETHQSLPYRHDGHPANVWSVPTESYLQFIGGNFDKITTAIEIANVTSPEVRVPLARTRFMVLMFWLLTNFFDCHLERVSMLADNTRETEDDGTIYGMGMLQSRRAHGFAWCLPRIDWNRLEFLEEYADHMIGNNRRLVTWYLQNAAMQVHDSFTSLGTCIDWLTAGRFYGPASQELVVYTCHLIMRMYREDCMAAMRKEFLPTAKGPLDSTMPFVWLTWVDNLKAVPHVVSGNRTKYRYPTHVYEWIWTDRASPSHLPFTMGKGTHPSGQFVRTHFDNKPFRLGITEIRHRLKEVPDVIRQVDDCLISQFFLYHPAIPYPDVNAGSLLSTNKKECRRQLYLTSTTTRQDGRTSTSWTDRGGHDEKKLVQIVPPLPSMLKMTIEQVERHLQSIQVRAR